MDRGKNKGVNNLIYELSSQNEILNKNNNELNIKILSLAHTLKLKENKINIINKLLIKKALKIIFLNKYIKENKPLLKAFINLKYYKKKKYLQSNLFYDHDIFFYILKTNKNNLIDKGIGNYNINLKFYIRRQICLTLLKKRKYNQSDTSYIDKSFNNNNLNNNKYFECILPQKMVNNFFIKSLNINKKIPGMTYNNDLEIKNNINYNIINNIKKNKIFDFSVSHLKIICQKKKMFDNKKLISNNIINYSILLDKDILNYKNEIEKYNEMNMNINKENEKLKNELIQNNQNIEKMKIINQNNKLQIDELSKKIIQLNEELNQVKSENIFYKQLENNNNKNEKLFSCTKFNFIINSNININKNNYDLKIFKILNTNFNIISNYIKKDKNNFFNNLSKSNNINYNINSLINNNNKHKEIVITKQEKLYIMGNISIKKEILSNFENALKDIENKNNLFKLLIFEIRLKNYILYHKYFFFFRFIHLSYNLKVKNTFDSLKNILIILKLKQLIKYLPLHKKTFYFYKYYSKSLSISFKENNNKLSQYIDKNEELEQKISLFSDTFKQYEQSHNNEEKKKNNELSKYKNTINDLNIKLEKIKNSAKESTEELINCNNECNNQKKIINGLNEEINELKKEKNILENKILSQQELIKNINTKMKQYQEENEQNENNYNLQIDKVKTKFDEYENNINELNNEKELLIKDNEKLKITIENLNNSNEKMFEIVKNSKNYEIENEHLLNENKILKNDNEIINKKYKGLKEDFDNLKILSEESKDELTKAMHEMELYSQLLQTLENKITIAEKDKKNALNERDKAINDVKILRQRYINIMGDGFI